VEQLDGPNVSRARTGLIDQNLSRIGMRVSGLLPVSLTLT
jgi:hypothetical protein